MMHPIHRGVRPIKNNCLNESNVIGLPVESIYYAQNGVNKINAFDLIIADWINSCYAFEHFCIYIL